MNEVLLYVFVAVSLAMVAPALWRRDYRLQFPCLAGITVIFQVALPLASLLSQPGEVSTAAITRFSIMAILCLVSAWLGYSLYRPPSNMLQMQFAQKRLATAAILLVVFGLLFTLKARSTTPDIDPETNQWTGAITIYATLANVMRYGAMLAAIIFFQTRNWKYLLLILPQLWQYYELFIVGRRSPTGEIAVVICVLLFFHRKWALPLWLLGLGSFIMALFCFNIGTIRETNDQPVRERLEAISASDPLHNISIEGMAEKRSFVEVYNGANFMEAKAKGGHYTWGLHFWNKLVFGYVPAQIVGRGIKDGLMIDLPDDTTIIGYEKSNGTCETGIGEAFMSFGYFGCGLFFVLGAFMRWLWEGALRKSVMHELLLMVCVLPAVMTFSIQLWTVINLLANFAVFVGPLLWWSRIRVPHRRRAKRKTAQAAMSH